MIAEARDVTPRHLRRRHKHVSPFARAFAVAEVDRLRRLVELDERKIVELNSEPDPDLGRIGAWRSAWQNNTRFLAEAENRLAKL